MRRRTIVICVSLLVVIGGINILWAEGSEETPLSRKVSGKTAQTAYKVISSKSKTCIECHRNVTPGIVADWQESKHVQAGISCFECHKAKKSDTDSELHNGFTISPIVSPKDCAACHPAEAVQFGQSLHAYAAVFTEGAGAENPLNLFSDSASSHGCLECHGTTLKITRDGDKIKKIDGWPNNGIGRINPDGSKGSCTACHTRHTFSIAEARKPDTCGQCHLGPDHPQIEIYNESKHGNIYRSRGNSWNWNVPAGRLTAKDIGAPTCAVCHMSAFNGVKGTHDVSSRLYWELETPISVKTNGLAADGKTPLRSFWKPADTNPDSKRADMKQVCAACHSPRWTDNYFTVADKIVKLYNKNITGIKVIYDRMKSEGLVDNKKFNEPADFKYFEAWHHEGRRMRFGAFMMGPDYEHWHGTYDLARDRAELLDMEKTLRFIHSADSGK